MPRLLCWHFSIKLKYNISFFSHFIYSFAYELFLISFLLFVIIFLIFALRCLYNLPNWIIFSVCEKHFMCNLPGNTFIHFFLYLVLILISLIIFQLGQSSPGGSSVCADCGQGNYGTSPPSAVCTACPVGQYLYLININNLASSLSLFFYVYFYYY